MAFYAISDLHLSHCVPKPMSKFGMHWDDHWNRIRQNWLETISIDDVVLIPGDISWAMQLSEAQFDLDEISELPGIKIMIKGNHDYWWSSPSQIRLKLPSNMFIIQNDSILVDNIVVCGTRGWLCPNDGNFSGQDQKIYQRELQRLKLSLESGKRWGKFDTIVMMHYPPFNDKKQVSGFTDLFKKYNICKVIYGHLHGESLKYAVNGVVDGINYDQVSCDNLQFQLKKII